MTQRRFPHFLPALVVAPLLLLPSALRAQVQTVDLAPARDNTLYEYAGGTISNGAGEYLFAGVVGNMGGNTKRRAVLAFDVAAALPNGAIVTSATLTLYMSMSIVGETDVSLHRLTADWGEAGSDAPGQEGQGTGALAGDATWLNTFFDTVDWAAPGGDFAVAASATAAVAGDGSYSWGPSSGLTADVQGWVNAPASEYGWIVLGDEVLPPPTAKRFDSRENATAENRPSLRIEYIDSRLFDDGFESGDLTGWSSSAP